MVYDVLVNIILLCIILVYAVGYFYVLFFQKWVTYELSSYAADLEIYWRCISEKTRV
jgi:hypothetical protein